MFLRSEEDERGEGGDEKQHNFQCVQKNKQTKKNPAVEISGGEKCTNRQLIAMVVNNVAVTR